MNSQQIQVDFWLISISIVSQGVLNTTQRRQTGEMTIPGVDSCRNYTLAVRCAINEAPWSSWSQEQTILTKLNSKNCVQTPRMHQL